MSTQILSGAWLIVAVLSLAAGIHKTFYSGFAESYQFFILFLVAIIIFYLRKNKSTKIKED